MVDFSVLNALISAPVMRAVFNTIVQERRILYKDLLERMPEHEKAAAAQSLSQLKQANLIREAASDLEDFNSYSVTEDGLLAERQLRNIPSSPLASR